MLACDQKQKKGGVGKNFVAWVCVLKVKIMLQNWQAPVGRCTDKKNAFLKVILIYSLYFYIC
jgi:hypothetical protein